MKEKKPPTLKIRNAREGYIELNKLNEFIQVCEFNKLQFVEQLRNTPLGVK